MLQRFPDDQVPTCSDPQHLPLVDAAYARPGGPAAVTLRTRLCPTCPVASLCLDEAMTRGEHGVWGGTSPKLRTQHGAKRMRARTA